MKVIQRLAARQADAFKNRPVVIAFLGDSVTHGCFDLAVDPRGNWTPHYMPEQGYAARVGRRFNQLFPAAAVSIINAGVSGGNAADGLNRLERDVLAFRPDLVVVNFGLNDAMNPDTDMGIANYRLNLTGIFAKIQMTGAEAMLVTPNFMCSYVPGMVLGDSLREIARKAADIQNGGVLTRYVEAARSVAATMQIPVADAYRRWELMAAQGVDTTALLSNGINHPTVEMHELFVEEIMRKAFEA